MRGQTPFRCCLKPPSSLSTNNNFSSPASQDNTSTSSVQCSPTVNLSREYYLIIQTNSYSEIRRKFAQDSSSLDQNVTIGHVDVFEEPQLLEHVLQPTRESVLEALSLTNPNPLTYLVTTFFDHSEHSSRLYLLFYQRIHNARLLYHSIHSLLDDLSLEIHSDYYSLSPSQCDSAFNQFLKFDCVDNPFLYPDSHSFNDMRNCLTQLREQLDHHRRKSKSRLHLVNHCSRGCALCLIAAAVGVVVSAVAIATHALVALVASPVCPAILPSSMTKREEMHIAQIDAAAKGSYVLRNDLDTIDRLVARLRAAVENDRLLIHLGLERGRDKYSIQEIHSNSCRETAQTLSNSLWILRSICSYALLLSIEPGCFFSKRSVSTNSLSDKDCHQMKQRMAATGNDSQEEEYLSH